MSYLYDNSVHYTQQRDRRLGLTDFTYFGRISSRVSWSPLHFLLPEGNASRAPWIFTDPTLSGRRVGRFRVPKSVELVVLRSVCQQRSAGRQPVPGRPTRSASLASVIVELTLCRRHAYVDSTQRGGHRVGHLPSRPLGSIRKHLYSHAAPRRVRALLGRLRPARDLIFPYHAGQGRHPDGDVFVHAHGLGTVAPSPAHASGASLRSRLPDDGRRGHAFLRQGRGLFPPRRRRFHLGKGPGRRHETARALRLPKDVEVGVGQARGAHHHGGRAVVGETLQGTALPLRRHLGPARALGRARVLHLAVPRGLRGAPDLPQLRQVGGGRTHPR